MSRRVTWPLSAVILVVGLLGTASAAKADTCSTSSSTGSCSINLTITNGPTGEPAGFVYGTVTLTLNSDGTITFDVSATSGYGFHNAEFGFNNNSGGTIYASGFNYTYAGKDPGAATFTASGFGQMDSFGSYDAGWTGGTGSSSDYTTETFIISTCDRNASPTCTSDFTSLSELISGNGNGDQNYFVGQLAQLSSGCTGFVGNTGSTSTGTDGFNGSSTSCTPVTTPEPQTDGMLALGLIGVGGVGLIWRRRREIWA